MIVESKACLICSSEENLTPKPCWCENPDCLPYYFCPKHLEEHYPNNEDYPLFLDPDTWTQMWRKNPDTLQFEKYIKLYDEWVLFPENKSND